MYTDLGGTRGGKKHPTSDVVAFFRDTEEGREAHAKLNDLAAWLETEVATKVCDRDHPTCVQHGDFHGGNVMYDSQKSPWIIDFAHSSDDGLMMTDLAKMESCLMLEYALGPLHDSETSSRPNTPRAGTDLLWLADQLYSYVLPWDAAENPLVPPNGHNRPSKTKLAAETLRV